jgi:hypothetical protein
MRKIFKFNTIRYFCKKTELIEKDKANENSIAFIIIRD